jgi:hypothetical protein
MQKRGIVYLEATVGRLFFSDIELKGHYEVTILEEANDLYRVEFKDSLLRVTAGVPEWIRKSACQLVKD